MKLYIYLFVLFLYLQTVFINIVKGGTPTDAGTLIQQIHKGGFVENRGQMHDMNGRAVPNVLFRLDTGSQQVYITEQGLTYVFTQTVKDNNIIIEHKRGSKAIKMCRLDELLQGATIRRENIERVELQRDDYFNYFLPGCGSGIQGVHAYKTIRVHDIYPHINWVIYTTKEGVKYDFEVGAGANPNLIRLLYKGADNITITKEGNLHIQCALGDITEQKPVSIQGRVEKHTSYVLSESSIVAFNIEKYDSTLPLRIDPQLYWGTLIGGINQDAYYSITADKNGNMYAVGSTQSVNFPIQANGGFLQGVIAGFYSSDVIISKFNNTGALVWSTFYGGSYTDIANCVKTDANGNVFVTGLTYSQDFPVLRGTGYYDSTFGGFASSNYKAFLLKFSNTGTRIFATYIGGTNNDVAFGLDIDNNSNVYIVGRTGSTNFPVKKAAGFYNGTLTSGENGFLMKFSNSGVLQWSTFIGGTGLNECLSVSADHLGNVFVTGGTNSSSGFPLQNATGSYYNGQINNNSSSGWYDAFIMKFDQNTNLLWSTLYGGSDEDIGVATAIDNNNNLIVTGETQSSDFPTFSTSGSYIDSKYGNVFGGYGHDVFILKFNNAGARLWATYFGGKGDDAQLPYNYSGFGSTYDNYLSFGLTNFNTGECVSDACGNIYIGFTTTSNNVQTLNTGCNAYYNSNLTGYSDGYIAKFTKYNVYKWGTYLGGQDPEVGVSLALNNNSDLFATWQSYGSFGLPYAQLPGGYYGNTSFGGTDIFLLRLNNAKPSVSVNSLLCSSGCTGSASAVVNSVCPGSYSYLWSNGAQTSSVNNLCTGSYSLIVVDTTGCAADTVGFTIKSGTLNVMPAITPYSCQYTCDGTASVSLPGVTGATYTWHVDKKIITNTSSITNLCPGNDTLVIAVPGCATQTVYFNEPLPPLVTGYISSITPASCPKGCDARATIVLTGGEKAPHATWSNSVKGTLDSTLCANTSYVVTITDSSCYAATMNVHIPADTPAISVQFQGCGCRYTAYLASSVYMGPQPYTYKWSNGEKGANDTDLCAGTYSLVLSSSCSKDSVSFTIPNNPPSIFVSTTPACKCDGTATVLSVSNQSYPIHVQWSTGDTTWGISNLCPGKYKVKVSGPCGVDSETVQVKPLTPLGIVGFSASSVACANGCTGIAFPIDTGGKMPFYYLWSNGQTNEIADSLCAGHTYYLKMWDVCADTVRDSVTVTATITSPLGGSVTPQYYTCPGLCNGVAQVSAYGGTYPYTYQWPNGQTGSTGYNLCTDSTYKIIISDACNQKDTVKYKFPHAPTLVVSTGFSPTCIQACQGIAYAYMSGGVAPYTFLWSNGQKVNPITNGCPNTTYTVVVTDLCGVKDSNTVTVGVAPPLQASVAVTSKACPSTCNGVATVTYSGGEPPILYYWSNNTFSQVAYNLCADSTYYVIVTEPGCMADTFNIKIPSFPLVKATVSSTPSCPLACNGIGKVAITAGRPPYTYLWSNGKTSAIDSTLCAGANSVVITDSCGDKDTLYVTTPTMTMSALITSQTNNNCYTVCNGAATVAATGGLPPYKYLWSNGQSTATATALCAGTYSVVVSSPGCIRDTVHVTIKDIQIKASISTQSVTTCANVCTGKATVTVAGGNPPYTYKWSNGQTINPDTTLCAGSNWVIVTKPGCTTDTAYLTIGIATPIVTSLGTLTNPNCYDLCDGIGTVNVSGGVPPYTFLWSNGQTIDTANKLCAGVNSVVVSNPRCYYDTLHFTLTAPTKMSATLTAFTVPLCYNICTGTASVNATGGTPPFTYLWNNGQTTTNATNLCPGADTVIVTQPGCSADTITFTLTPVSHLIINTQILSNATCYDTCNGFASINVAGGKMPYTYKWNTGQVISTANKLCAGQYVITVTDSLGCKREDTLYIKQPLPVSINSIEVSSHCENMDGSITITATGGNPPYTYFWSTGSHSTSIQNLTHGIYNLLIVDSNACHYYFTDTLAGIWPVVKASPDTTIYAGNNVDLKVYGALTYEWWPSTSLSCTNCQFPVFSGYETMQYCVSGTDSFGCADTVCITVNVDRKCGVPNLPNAFTPNNDGKDDYFRVLGYCLDKVHLIVFNRWGELMFEGFTQEDKWDGKYKGIPANQDTYEWILDATNLFGEKFHMKGDVTLIR